jgi:hypothetical protein
VDEALCYKPEGREFVFQFEVIEFLNLPDPFSLSGSGVDSASNRNEYRNLPGVKGQPARKAHNLTTISEPIV